MPAPASLPLGLPALLGGSSVVSTPPPAPVLRGLQVIHAGQDITQWVDEGTIAIQSVLGQGPGAGAGGSGQGSTCTFDARLGPVPTAIGKGQATTGTSLVRQGQVTIYDTSGFAVFNGYLTKLDDASESINPITTFNCVDGWQHLDRTEVNENYTASSDVFIIKDLLTKYAPWVDQSLLTNLGDNFIFARRVVKGTLRACIQSIADITGWYVFMDSAFALHYVSPTSATTASFGLSDAPNEATTFGMKLTEYELDDNAIINRVYFYGGKHTSPDFVQDLRPQANGFNKTFALAYVPDDAADGAKHIILNGVEQAVGSVFDTSSKGTFKSAGGTSDVLINAGQQVAMFDVAPATGLTQLDAKYRYQTPLVVVLTDQNSHTFFGEWFDGRITDSTILDFATAIERSRVLLAEQSFGLLTMQVLCWQPGLQAGQTVAIQDTVRGISASYLIQQVDTKPLGAGQFEYELTCGAWNWGVLDMLIQGARALSPTDANLEEDTSVIQAMEQVAGATAAFALISSTHPSGAYYSGQTATKSGFFTVTS